MPIQSSQVAAIGATTPIDAGVGNTFGHFAMKLSGPVDAVAHLQTSPDVLAWTDADVATGPNWAVAGLNVRARAIRANVTALGTGGAPVGVVVSASP
jgi:hypothetical protein